jgi:Zn-dependent peptidase ImmA (M78 family)
VKHGFKAQAERLSLAEREALGLTERCRLDPTLLAESKGYPVIPLSDLEGVPTEHRQRLQAKDPSAFSAAAVVLDNDALIIVNDAHTRVRQVNSVAHELSHLLLGHEPAEAFGDFGSRTVTETHEDEADWLAGCLLVPASGIPATMSECEGKLEAAADRYGVSVQLMRWRFNKTQRRRSQRSRR